MLSLLVSEHPSLALDHPQLTLAQGHTQDKQDPPPQDPDLTKYLALVMVEHEKDLMSQAPMELLS